MYSFTIFLVLTQVLGIETTYLQFKAPTYMGRLTEMSKGMIRNISDAYEMLEGYLSENLYMADEVITIADISIASTMATLVGLVAIDAKRFVIFDLIYEKNWDITLLGQQLIVNRAILLSFKFSPLFWRYVFIRKCKIELIMSLYFPDSPN